MSGARQEAWGVHQLSLLLACLGVCHVTGGSSLACMVWSQRQGMALPGILAPLQHHTVMGIWLPSGLRESGAGGPAGQGSAERQQEGCRPGGSSCQVPLKPALQPHSITHSQHVPHGPQHGAHSRQSQPSLAAGVCTMLGQQHI